MLASPHELSSVVFSYFQSVGQKWLVLFIDLILFLLVLFAWDAIWHCDLLRESKAFLVLSTLLAWSGLHGRELVYFDYILFSFRVFLRALFFCAVFFFFAGHFENIEFALVCYSTWLVISLLFKRYVYQPNQNKQFLVIDKDVLERFKALKYLSFKLLPKQFDAIAPEDYRGLIVDVDRDYPKVTRKFIAHCKAVGMDVLTLNDFEEIHYRRVNAEALDGALLENSFAVNRTYLMLKYFFDVLFTLMLLPVILVLLVVVALLILVTMGQPVIFTQERIGQDGRIFKIYKFRTMKAHKTRRETSELDDRITPIGKFLRKMRLDEIPQFFNILKGDMSLIGPRPEWEFTAKQFTKEIPVYFIRHTVKPGITGWAQVQMGHATGVDENFAKLRYDLFYVKYLSFWLDTKIMLKTLYTVLTGFGAK